MNNTENEIDEVKKDLNEIAVDSINIFNSKQNEIDDGFDEIKNKLNDSVDSNVKNEIVGNIDKLNIDSTMKNQVIGKIKNLDDGDMGKLIGLTINYIGDLLKTDTENVDSFMNSITKIGGVFYEDASKIVNFEQEEKE